MPNTHDDKESKSTNVNDRNPTPASGDFEWACSVFGFGTTDTIDKLSIHDRYVELACDFHPEMNLPHLQEWAKENYKKLQRAKEILEKKGA